MFNSSSITSPGGFLISVGVQQQRKSVGSNIKGDGGRLDCIPEKREGKLDECVSVRLYQVRNHKNSLIKLGIGPLSEKFSEKFN
jgi:hypothetical protein